MSSSRSVDAVQRRRSSRPGRPGKQKSAARLQFKAVQEYQQFMAVRDLRLCAFMLRALERARIERVWRVVSSEFGTRRIERLAARACDTSRNGEAATKPLASRTRQMDVDGRTPTEMSGADGGVGL